MQLKILCSPACSDCYWSRQLLICADQSCFPLMIAGARPCGARALALLPNRSGKSITNPCSEVMILSLLPGASASCSPFAVILHKSRKLMKASLRAEGLRRGKACGSQSSRCLASARRSRNSCFILKALLICRVRHLISPYGLKA